MSILFSFFPFFSPKTEPGTQYCTPGTFCF
jgi:hypothetical protein